jgi:serine/threonine protein kinase
VAVTPERDPLRGTPYRAVRLLQVGGVSKIYEAQDHEKDQRFTVKILRKKWMRSLEMIERMRLEAAVVTLVRHPNVVLGYRGAMTPAGRPYIVMERLRGRTLHEEVVRRGALEIFEAIHYVRQALEGLAAVHSLGVIHRDLKPENVFLDRPAPGPPTVKLLDFGSAKVLTPACHATLTYLAVSTTDGQFAGTPRYAAPELIDAESTDADQRADVYTMGLVLAMLVSGQEPYPDIESQSELLAAQIAKTLDLPSPDTDRVSEEMVTLIRRAVAKDRKERFPTAQAFSDELGSFVERHQASIPDVARPRRLLTVEQHAQMTAELELDPRRGRDIRARFGIRSDESARAVEGWWQQHVGNNPKLEGKWRQRVDEHLRRLRGS